MDYYSAIKRDEVLMHAVSWLNLENIMLRITYCMISYIYEMSTIRKSIQKVDYWLPGVGGGGGVAWEWGIKGMENS